MEIHRLKTWPEGFQAIREQGKRFEIRPDDRGFQRGDILVLLEWSPETRRYTGQVEVFIVGHVERKQWGLPENLAIMQLEPPTWATFLEIREQEVDLDMAREMYNE